MLKSMAIKILLAIMNQLPIIYISFILIVFVNSTIIFNKMKQYSTSLCCLNSIIIKPDTSKNFKQRQIFLVSLVLQIFLLGLIMKEHLINSRSHLATKSGAVVYVGQTSLGLQTSTIKVNIIFQAHVRAYMFG